MRRVLIKLYKESIRQAPLAATTVISNMSQKADKMTWNYSIMSILKPRDSNSTSSSWKRHSPTNNRSLNEEIHKLTKKTQQVVGIYQQTPSPGAHQNKFRSYYGDAKYCRTCFGSGRAIKNCPLVPFEVLNIIMKQRKEIKQRTVKKPLVPYRREWQPYHGRIPADDYRTTPKQGCRAFNDERAASNSTLTCPQCLKGLYLNAWQVGHPRPMTARKWILKGLLTVKIYK